MTVLGSLVSGPGTRVLGVIGAAMVDEKGNTNSTWTRGGDFLVGSGGANDIATAADEVLVTIAHRRDRLVQAVPYVTCPGSNVRTIVTSRGVFERLDDKLVLTRLLPSPLEPEAAITEIKEESEWDFSIADDLVVESPPTLLELRTARMYDPARHFLRGEVPAPVSTAPNPASVS